MKPRIKIAIAVITLLLCISGVSPNPEPPRPAEKPIAEVIIPKMEPMPDAQQITRDIEDLQKIIKENACKGYTIP